MGMLKPRLDIEQATELVLAHRPLVRAMARRYTRPGVSLEDLEAEGCVGLLVAARRFDPSRGAQFSTYAKWWVRAHVQRYAMANRRIVAAPNTRAMRLLHQIRRIERNMEQAAGEPADVHDVARSMHMTVEQVEEAQAAISRRDLSTEPDGADRESLEPSDTSPSPEDLVASREWHSACRTMAVIALDALDPRERQIVHDRLLSPDRMTLADLGTRFGVTRERVRQLEARALRKMRTALSLTG